MRYGILPLFLRALVAGEEGPELRLEFHMHLIKQLRFVLIASHSRLSCQYKGDPKNLSNIIWQA